MLVANPAAQNGAGGAAIDRAAENLRAVVGQDNVVVARTVGPRHAIELARNVAGVGIVVALGGDGVVHEVANGLMQRPAHDRPTLGVLPLGSGNDYARALGLKWESVDEVCAQLLAARPRTVDVGKVNDQYFVETLSFGLDAAIALDTMERRKRTGKSGTALYMASGFDQLFHHLDTHNYCLSLQGERPCLLQGGYKASAQGTTHDASQDALQDAPEQGQSITFAVQVGPYYGGGFKICPDAALDDGAFDICISHAPITPLKAAAVFVKAKDGKHVSSKHIEMRRAQGVHVEFKSEPPCQADGERLEGKVFDISTVSQALSVVA